MKRDARPAKYVQSNIWIIPHTQIVSIGKKHGDEISNAIYAKKLTRAFDLKNALIFSLKLWCTGVEPVGLLRISWE